MRYATRNDAFSPVMVWLLDGTTLRCEPAGGPPRVTPLSDLREIRLTFAPTRPEPNRFRCRLTRRDGTTQDFFNRTYRSPYDFVDTSAEYVAFVRALHEALAQQAPGCQFSAGATGTAYALNWAVTIFLGLVVLIAALFLLFNGLAWLILLKLSLIAIFAPNVFRWFARNKPRQYPPAQIPPCVVPALLPT